jgi:actin-related protein
LSAKPFPFDFVHFCNVPSALLYQSSRCLAFDSNFANLACSLQALREQLVQLMFEKFNVSGFYDSEQAVLSLYAVGRISGCTVDIGHGKIGNIQLYLEFNCSLVDSTLVVADKLSS